MYSTTAKLPFSHHSNWSPQPPPSLDGIDNIELDIESTGLEWWKKDRPIGIAIGLPDGSTQYLPWGHIGGNLSEGVVRDWAKKELRNKLITNHTTKFDIHMMREWGVDLEEQGCTVSDVAHYAALLDDHRKRFSLDILSQDFLGEEKIQGLDKTAMADYHAGNVAAYAERDVELVHKLKKHLWPLLDEQDLQRVRQLEDDLIFPVCEMERNAAPIDVELLNEWVEESEQEYIRTLWEIHRETGSLINPNSSKDLTKIFNKLKLPFTDYTEKGQPSFADSTLAKIDHPAIILIRRAARLSSLRSKYLLPYQRSITPDNKLHYHLHQLRTDKKGTVRGRFSATDKNVQAVLTAKKQIDRYGKEFVIRELYIPASGLFFSADASQIEYRLFAHYSGSPNLLNAYKDDPEINFHETVQGMLKPFKPNIDYKRTKDLNFAKIYGAGRDKVAEMVGLPRQESDGFVNVYDRLFPEAHILLKKATNVAENRGYVKTILGRRARFPDGKKAYAALNAIIQGTAADIMKVKIIILHAVRKAFGYIPRFPVHDEACGDVPDKETAGSLGKLLNEQSFPLKVPILWEVKTGANWGECG